MLVYAETGSSDAKTLIMKRQASFLSKRMARDDFHDSPLEKAMAIANNARSPMAKQLNEILNMQDCPVDLFSQTLETKITTATTTRAVTYMDLNPSLTVHTIYSKTPNVYEHKRIATTRIRLASHRLKIETGRWSRIPRERRLCTCGDIQDEQHVLLKCPLTEHVRTYYNVQCSTMKDLMDLDPKIISEFIFDAMKIF